MKTNLGDPHRNFVDFGHVPVVKRLTRLPIGIDPSHSVGSRAQAPDGLLDIFHATAGIIAGANLVLVDFPAGRGPLRRTRLLMAELPRLINARIVREAYRARVRRVACREPSLTGVLRGLLRALFLVIAGRFLQRFRGGGYFRASTAACARASRDAASGFLPCLLDALDPVSGLDWKLVDLRGTLDRLGFRKANSSGKLQPGEYAWGDSRVRIHLQAFNHPTRSEPARDVVLRLDGSLIEEIRELPSGHEIGAVLLEPEPIGAFYGSNHEQRELVKLDQLPPHLIDAILAVEDQRFEEHRGIDLRRIAGALIANLRAGEVCQGGSTVTQQLVKNFFLTPERTLKRKVQEAAMALVVEARYEKHEILETYLNEIYLGQRGPTAIHGVGEAAHVFFGKSARELDVAESALVAAVIHSPNGLSPYRESERAVRRRNLVLEMMEEQGRIDAETRARAQAEPLRLAAVTPDPGDARYFLDLLRRQLSDVYDASVLERDGLRIYSTLDRRAQRLAAIALREGLADLEKRYPRLHSEQPARALQGCLVALRPQTGELLALVGGRDYATRSSTAARRRGGRPAAPSSRSPTPRRSSPTGGARDHAREPARRFAVRGLDPERAMAAGTTTRNRTGWSRFARRSRTRSTSRRRGWRGASARGGSPTSRGAPGSSRRCRWCEPRAGRRLGRADRMARAYATFASGGRPPRAPVDRGSDRRRGPHPERRKLRFERVLDAGTAFLTTSPLEGVADRGTAASVRATGLRGPVAADRHHRSGAGPLAGRLHARAGGGGLDRLRRAPQPQDHERRGSPPDLAPLRARHDRRPDPRALPEAGRRRGGRDRSRDSVAVSGCPERTTEYFLAGTAPTSFCGDGSMPAPVTGGDGVAERPPERRDDSTNEFLRWIRRQL